MHQTDELLCGCRLSFPCSNFQGHPFPNHIIKCSSLNLKKKKKAAYTTRQWTTER